MYEPPKIPLGFPFLLLKYAFKFVPQVKIADIFEFRQGPMFFLFAERVVSVSLVSYCTCGTAVEIIFSDAFWTYYTLQIYINK